MPVMIRPIRASSGAPEVMLLRSSRLLPAVTIPAFSRPIRQMNRPIPGADGGLQGRRNGINDLLADRRDGDRQEDQAGDEHDRQTLLPGVAHFGADGVGEERIQTHAGSLRKGNVRHEGGQEAADGGGDAGGQHDGGLIHARLGQEVGVDEDDVSHREERRQAADHFRADVGVVLFELKQLFHGESLSFSECFLEQRENCTFLSSACQWIFRRNGTFSEKNRRKRERIAEGYPPVESLRRSCNDRLERGL